MPPAREKNSWLNKMLQDFGVTFEVASLGLGPRFAMVSPWARLPASTVEATL